MSFVDAFLKSFLIDVLDFNVCVGMHIGHVWNATVSFAFFHIISFNNMNVRTIGRSHSIYQASKGKV